MEHLLTPDQVAEGLGVSTTQLAQWRYEGRGPAYQRLSAKNIRYRAAAVEEFIEQSTRTSTLAG